jgi:hypothetical protein
MVPDFLSEAEGWLLKRVTIELVAERSQAHGLDGCLERSVGGDNQDERLGPSVPDVAHQVQSRARAGHLEVGDGELMGRTLKESPVQLGDLIPDNVNSTSSLR